MQTATKPLNDIALEQGWKTELAEAFAADYMQNLKQFLQVRKQAGAVIFPKGADIFNAFNSTPFDKVKVVILGQDPYHGPNQAHGLCFSVKPGVPVPPSLKNIYKELAADIPGFQIPRHGFLQNWAEQGVLMLNSVLTVEQGQAGAHQNKGWEHFTDEAIKRLNADREGLVFMLWGSYAHKKGQVVDASKHLVLKAAHPSPLSAHNGFLGCRHFSKANNYLIAHGKQPIEWNLPLTVV